MTLLVIALFIINIFVYTNLRQRYIKEVEDSFITQAQILSNRVLVAVNEPEYTIDRLTASQIIEKITHLIEGRVLIVDISKNVIFDSFHLLNDEKIEVYEVVRALKGEKVVNAYQLEKYGKVLYIGVPITQADHIYGAVFISTSMEEVYESINDVRNMLFVISLITLLLVTIMSAVFTNIISRPIKKLIFAMKRTSQGILNEKIDIQSNDEFGQLAHAYNFMNTKLSHIEKQRRDFVANVSHELKTPLASIKILAESLIGDKNSNIDKHREFLKDINSEMNRLNDIVDDLLVLVDLDEEKLSLKLKKTSLNSLVDRVLATILPLTKKRNIGVIVEHNDNINIVIDQNKMYQALINIIHNAEKYTENNGCIYIRTFHKNKYATIEIQDNGIGIPNASLPYIFDRFYRVNSDRARKTGGSGIGLSIANRIVSLHQGRIEVNSEIGKGTTFSVKLPNDPRQYRM
ncbi:MAG: sensor histidine kinase [Alkaliphilus sp.]